MSVFASFCVTAYRIPRYVRRKPSLACCLYQIPIVSQSCVYQRGSRSLRTRCICLETSVFFLWISLPQSMLRLGCSGSPHMHYPCPSRGVERIRGMPTDPTRQMSRRETHRSWRGPETNSSKGCATDCELRC